MSEPGIHLDLSDRSSDTVDTVQTTDHNMDSDKMDEKYDIELEEEEEEPSQQVHCR